MNELADIVKELLGSDAKIEFRDNTVGRCRLTLSKAVLKVESASGLSA
jgi:hypothetical protein